MSGQIVGYARVSTAQQNEARQVEALGSVDRLYIEKVSGANRRDRPQLEKMIDFVREGDTVRVKSPDRLARSTRDLLDLIEELREEGVAVEFTDAPLLNVDPRAEKADHMAAAMLGILSVLAEMERNVLLERQAEGIAIAKAKGKYARGPKLQPEQIREAREQVDAGVPKAKVARQLKVSRQTLYSALKGVGRYAATTQSANEAPSTGPLE